MEVKQNLLELKEAGIIGLQWVSTVSNETDMLMKNLAGSERNKHATRLCEHDKYYSTAQDGESYD